VDAGEKIRGRMRQERKFLHRIAFISSRMLFLMYNARALRKGFLKQA
jgi:hypothetical protein